MVIEFGYPSVFIGLCSDDGGINWSRMVDKLRGFLCSRSILMVIRVVNKWSRHSDNRGKVLLRGIRLVAIGKCGGCDLGLEGELRAHNLLGNDGELRCKGLDGGGRLLCDDELHNPYTTVHHVIYMGRRVDIPTLPFEPCASLQ
jgi:hypothetical protein